MEGSNLRPLAAVVVAMVVLNTLWPPFVLLTVTFAPAWFGTHVAPVANAGDAAQVVFRVATMVAFGRWIYLAGRNLIDAGVADLEFTPAARIWWFAVPFANVFKPYQGMRELWNASRGEWPRDANPPLIGIWWALWLGNALVGYVSRLFGADRASAMAVLWTSTAASLGLAAAAILIVRGITRAQAALGDGADLTEVFA